MNYDHFEREVLGYQAAMRCRAERSRMMRAGSAANKGGSVAGHPVRLRMAGALRTLANRLESGSANLA